MAAPADMKPLMNTVAATSREGKSGKGGFHWKWLLWITAGVALLAAAKVLGAQQHLNDLLLWVQQRDSGGAAVFIAIYVAATVLFVPGSALTLGAGALFGVVWGTIYVSLGSTLGATAAFLLGRSLARDKISRRIEGNERFAAMDRAVAREGWKIVLLTRLSPAFPFTLLNYAFGLTRVKLGHYVLASWIGMMPGTLMYVYFGSLARVAAGQRARTTGEWVLYGVGLLTTVGVTVLVTRLARQTLAGKIGQPGPSGSS